MLQIKRGSRSWWGALVLDVVVAATSMLYLVLSDTLHTAPKLFAVAAGALGIAGLGRLLNPSVRALTERHPSQYRALRRALPYTVVTAAILWAFYPTPFELPINQDHGHHFFATKVFVQELLRSGNLFGWTDQIAGGMPFGDVYATPVYMLTSTLHVASLGLISLEFSYSIGVLFAWFLAGFTAIALVREVLSSDDERSIAVLGPTIAGLALILDPGGDREGGWVYSLFHAVWPQFLATALMTLGVLLLIRFVRVPTWRRMAASSIVFGIAIWMHPMVALNLVWLAPTVFVVVLVGAFRARGSAATALPWLVPLFSASAVMGMGYFARLLTARHAIKPFAAHGDELWLWGQNLLQASPFANQLPLVSALGILGVIAVIARRDLAGIVVLSLTSVFVLLGSMELVLSFDLGSTEWMPMLMYRRFFISAKAFWFVLVGVGASAAWMGVLALVRSIDNPLKAGTGWAFAAPLLWAAVLGSHVLLPAPVGQILGYDSSGVGHDLDALTKLLKTERATLDLDQTVVVDWRERGDGSHYRLFAYAMSDSRYLATKAPPCQALSTVLVSKNLAGLRWLGATHIVTEHQKNLANTKLIGKAGRFHLYRITKAGPPHPIELKGGEADVKVWGPMRREIAVSGTNNKSVLIVGQPPYSKWTATQNGRKLSIDSRKKGGVGVIQIGNLKDGTVVLEYHDTTFENVTFVLALLTTVALVLLFTLGGPIPRPLSRVPTLSGRVPAPSDTLRPFILYAATGGTLVAFVTMWTAASVLGDAAMKSMWQKDEPKGTRLIQVLHTDQPATFSYSPRPYCLRAFSRNPRSGCNKATLEPRITAGRVRSKKIPACLEFGIPDKGRSSLSFELPEGTTHVKGFLQLSKKMKAHITLGEAKHPLKPGAFKQPTKDLAKLHIVVENKGSTGTACVELVALSLPANE